MRDLQNYGDYELIKETEKAYLIRFQIQQHSHPDVKIGILRSQLPVKISDVWFPKNAIYSTDTKDYIKDWYNMSETQKSALCGNMTYKDSMQFLEYSFSNHYDLKNS